jgi:hypothetical protein
MVWPTTKMMGTTAIADQFGQNCAIATQVETTRPVSEPR